MTLSKNLSMAGRSFAISSSALRNRLRPQLLDHGHGLRDHGGELLLGFFLEAHCVDTHRNNGFLFICLAQNVLHALEGAGDGCEISRSPHLAHRFGAGGRIHHVVGIDRKHCVNHVIRVSRFMRILQVELQPFAEKTAHRFGVAGVRELLLGLGVFIAAARIGHDLGEAQRQFVLGDRLHNAVGLAAEREWILRPAGNEPQREHSRDRIRLVAIERIAPSIVVGAPSSIDSGL